MPLVLHAGEVPISHPGMKSIWVGMILELRTLKLNQITTYKDY